MATLTSIAYARTRVRRGRTGQRVRLSAVITAQAGSVFNDTHAFGNYARVSDRSGGVYFAWSPYPVGPPFEHDTAVSATHTCTEPRFCWTPSRSLYLTLNDSGTAVARRSDSDGLDWNAPATLFTGIAHPDITASRETGMILYAAYDGGALAIRRQAPGDTAIGAAFNAEDDAAADLALSDTDFRLVYAPNGWLYLHYLPDGASDTVILQSYDDGESFAPSGSGGIAGGDHPGICCAADGALYAYARTSGGEVHLFRRYPGDTAWSTPAAIEDAAGDPILVADQAFSMAVGFEGPRRLVMAAVLDGETSVSELASADEGISFAVLPT